MTISCMCVSEKDDVLIREEKRKMIRGINERKKKKECLETIWIELG